MKHVAERHKQQQLETEKHLKRKFEKFLEKLLTSLEGDHILSKLSERQ